MNDFVLLIPYYNCYGGLVNSVNSISYPVDKYDILIVDDGSKNEINIQEIEKLKPGVKIKIIRLPENQGIAKALNTGLRELHKRNDYNYIARLDCSDTCHPARFTSQIKFMNEHPEIALLGTWCSFTDKHNWKSYIYKTKLKHKDIMNEMHFKCSFIHPTVMFRREILDAVGYYPENYPHAEDYIYFWKILLKFQVFVLSQNLVTITVNRNNLSYIHKKEQFSTRKKIVSEMGSNLFNKLLGLSYLQLVDLLPAKLLYKLKFVLS